MTDTPNAPILSEEEWGELRELATKAIENFDWQQVILNMAPPCFHLLKHGSFCGRAERWPGHDDVHPFVPFIAFWKGVRSLDGATLAQARREGAEALSEDVFIPSHLRCPKCEFYLVSQTLYVKSGNIGLRDAGGELCPNDGTMMVPVKWKEAYENVQERLRQDSRRLEVSGALAVAYKRGAEEMRERAAKKLEKCLGGEYAAKVVRAMPAHGGPK